MISRGAESVPYKGKKPYFEETRFDLGEHSNWDDGPVRNRGHVSNHGPNNFGGQHGFVPKQEEFEGQTLGFGGNQGFGGNTGFGGKSRFRGLYFFGPTDQRINYRTNGPNGELA